MGEYERNPFKFNLLNIITAKATAEGVNYPMVPYIMHLDRKQMSREFVDFMKCLGYYQTSNGNGISWKDYVQGYGILVLVLLAFSSILAQIISYKHTVGVQRFERSRGRQQSRD